MPIRQQAVAALWPTCSATISAIQTLTSGKQVIEVEVGQVEYAAWFQMNERQAGSFLSRRRESGGAYLPLHGIDDDLFQRKAACRRESFCSRNRASGISIVVLILLLLEHAGSTSVPGLVAKPVVDLLLVVADSANEPAYAPALEAAGYALRIREPHWYEHRMFNGPDTNVNLHVFSSGCSEIDRMLLFRDRLRSNAADRELYARTKSALAMKDWQHVQDYADAKTTVVEEILARARANIGAARHSPVADRHSPNIG